MAPACGRKTCLAARRKEKKTVLPDHQYIERRSGRVVTEYLLADRWINFLYTDIREKAPTLFKAVTSSRASRLLGNLCFDGLKGYITNTKLSPERIVENYRHLWQIEKAFRISKTDLKIRPIRHRLRQRIEAHISIAFVAYTIYKELERLLCKHKAGFSPQRAAELTHNMYEIEYVLPHSQRKEKTLLKMDEEQQILHRIVNKH